MSGLTNKEVAARLGIAVRTWQRRRRVYRVRPDGFTGQVPVFLVRTIQAAERKRTREMAKLAERRAS